jgi:hypothetical protein
MSIISMDDELWKFWRFRMNALTPIEHDSQSRFQCLDRVFKRLEVMEKIGWKAKLPPLNLPFWFRSKWITPKGDLFRSEISTLFLVRNSNTGVVRVEFEYSTQTYDDDDKQWKLI